MARNVRRSKTGEHADGEEPGCSKVLKWSERHDDALQRPYGGLMAADEPIEISFLSEKAEEIFHVLDCGGFHHVCPI